MGYWYQGTSVGPAVSSLVAYGFGHWSASDHNLSFKSWQVLFLLYGLITILFGILVIFFLPNNPMKSRLRLEEKLHIIERVRDNQTGIEAKRFKWSQFKEVMLDVKTWLLSIIVISTNVPNGAVSSYSSIITEKYVCSTSGIDLLTDMAKFRLRPVSIAPAPAARMCSGLYIRLVRDLVGGQI